MNSAGVRMGSLVAGVGAFFGHLYAVNRAALGRGNGPLWVTAPAAIALLVLATYLWFGDAE